MEAGLTSNACDAPGTERPILVLNGSARPDGNTSKLIDLFRAHVPEGTVGMIALQGLELQDFNYDRVELDDDAFRPLIQSLIASDHVIFATPVYWYAMSAQMKRFFDRFTDLLLDTQAKPLARRLAGKRVGLIATGAETFLPTGFEQPFALTAGYFKMTWCGYVYVAAREDGTFNEVHLAELERFAGQLVPRREQHFPT